jgi:serine/threonine protein kinase
LVGHDLADGWRAVQVIPRPPGSTGGYFSVGYEAVRADGKRGFIKALDIVTAAGAPSATRVMQDLLTAYNFELDALLACRDRKLDRVATPIANGDATVPNYQVGVVPYLVFEMADGDVRRYLAATNAIETTWLIRCLHHVATGLRQLHGAGIAHQDLKPSNVLVFGGSESRVGDLGRASRQGVPAKHDAFTIAGARSYAPPELMYGHVEPDWNQRRLACDVYHLGNLFTFLFSKVNITQALIGELDPAIRPGVWSGQYADVLPHVRDAFNRVLGIFEKEVLRVAPRIGPELVSMVRELADPDPALRGNRGAKSIAARYSLERYISRLDALAYKARLGLA